MPPYSTLKTFIEALRTGETNIAKSLTKLMKDPAKWRPEIAELNTDAAVEPALSAWLEARCKNAGMSQAEIDHINVQWPMPQKKQLRQAVESSVNTGRPMVFRWGLTTGDAPQTDIVAPPADAPLSEPTMVSFLSPGAGVELSAINFGKIEVAR